MFNVMPTPGSCISTSLLTVLRAYPGSGRPPPASSPWNLVIRATVIERRFKRSQQRQTLAYPPLAHAATKSRPLVDVVGVIPDMMHAGFPTTSVNRVLRMTLPSDPRFMRVGA